VIDQNKQKSEGGERKIDQKTDRPIEKCRDIGERKTWGRDRDKVHGQCYVS